MCIKGERGLKSVKLVLVGIIPSSKNIFPKIGCPVNHCALKINTIPILILSSWRQPIRKEQKQ
jgi:hypothetical protein